MGTHYEGRPVPEKDWKYLRSIQPEMLNSLCAKINQKATDIIGSQGDSAHAKCLKLYKHIRESDKCVAGCFNDWRRSNFWMTILVLRRYGILTDTLVLGFTEEGRQGVQAFDSLPCR